MGKMLRASTDLHHDWLYYRDLDSIETLIGLERKFFLPRKQALQIIEDFRNAK
jgi:hypothetical protein